MRRKGAASAGGAAGGAAGGRVNPRLGGVAATKAAYAAWDPVA